MAPPREAPAVTGTLHGPAVATAGDPVAPTVPTGSAVGAVGSTDGAATADADGLDVSGLTASISRPLAEGNGEYSVAVSLHPPQLGEVRALLSLRGDTLEVTLSPEMAVGHEALEQALPALRDQLAANGLQVSVSLGDPRGQAGDRSPADGNRTGSGPDSATTTAPQTTDQNPLSTGNDGRIHLVL
ncbi:MAG: flagellar hook-length control protein FliK [Acidimicrobiales bacterium]